MECKRDKGKGIVIKIDDDMRKKINSFKKRLLQMSKYKEIPEKQRLIVEAIFSLEEYEQNFIIAYYELAEGSPSKLAKIFNCIPSTVTSNIRKIENKIKKICFPN